MANSTSPANAKNIVVEVFGHVRDDDCLDTEDVLTQAAMSMVNRVEFSLFRKEP
jgi:hypothetical protein